ncbi:hypothetical protein [Methylophaga nitratireducenticrescens]|uniref:hypothetical protein n=1 Tax=Methylophaga nitratireducenticrescens TaxID=754476 RepID=UPI000CDC19FD|nr:hypothetical protein [Methylophaga nitratireducenticrescens]AUZ85778.1 hypothetical protein CDW43_14940 [Methylophaga nitratireducenticrescens]AUZ85834.1 hypothetical protein CDW43_15235 [Methylophaga nitratireducenticrescens]
MAWHQLDPVRWSQLTPQQQATFGNGCGPRWLPKWFNRILHHYLFGWLFEASCRRHDFAYARGGTEVNRKLSNKRYFEAMIRDAKRLADDKKYGRHLAATLMALTYYGFVTLFGRFSFNYGYYLTLNAILKRDK